MRIAVTAGYDGSLPALLMCQSLMESGHDVILALVVSTIRPTRVLRELRTGGATGLLRSAARVLHKTPAPQSESLLAIDAMWAESNLKVKSIRQWCRMNSAQYKSVPGLNESRTLDALNDSKPEVLVYCGGGLLRTQIIDAMHGRIVNPHCGPLPQIRGMNAIEWALLLGEPLCVSIHYIDDGIDTGKLIGRYPVPVSGIGSVEALRSQAVATGILGVIDSLSRPLPSVGHDTSNRANATCDADTRQCFRLSPALQALLQVKLSNSNS